ncbi:MAG: c-type cytochrome [Chthoniobacter sp.]|nr:c-type cytochrome [Chthoniobacter sp.]
MKLSALLLACAAALPSIARAAEDMPPFPAHIPVPPATVLSPEEMLQSFSIAPGFKVELVASEPMISTPVAIQWDENGRLWVVEMNGYMRNPDGTGEDAPNGRVVVLEDTDGDGRMDKRTVFLDNVVMPRAIALRKGGALVCVPPNVLWCPDENHDLVADSHEVLIPNYTGGGNPEHLPNGLLLAMDGWYYSAKSSWRYRLHGNNVVVREPTVFHGQWGIAQDDFGRIYTSTSEQQLLCDLLPSTYLTRNPNFKESEAANVEVTENQRVFPVRVTPGVNRGYRKGILDDAGKLVNFTAASGPLIYRGDAFPAEVRGNAFTTEPTANLVKRIVLTEKDGGIMGRDAYEGREFLASTSERFRPVNLSDGPDGALYIVDMARGMVQHVTYLTPWLREQYGARKLEQPLDQGRIWRVVPEGWKRPKFEKLSAADVEQLVKELESPNGWRRDTAQRLIAERFEGGLPNFREVPSWFDSLLHPKGAKPAFARIAKAWTLAKIYPDCAEAMSHGDGPDPDGKVEATVLRITEPVAKRSAKIAKQLFDYAEDRRPAVQLQLLLTLGEIGGASAEAVMATVLTKNVENPLARTAALSGLRGRELEFLRALLAAPEWEKTSPGRETVVRQLVHCILQERQPERLDALLALAAAPPKAAWQQLALLDGLTPAKKAKPIKLPAAPPALARLTAARDAAVQERAGKIAALFTWPGQPGAAPEVKAPPLTAAQQEFVAKGAALYNTICTACHLPQGQGQEGLAPPLAGSEWVAGPESRLIRIVLHGVGGRISVAGKDYTLAMPGLGAALPDESVAQVLSYIRRSFGHEQPIVETATVTKVRAASKDRGAEWTAEELERFE